MVRAELFNPEGRYHLSNEFSLRVFPYIYVAFKKWRDIISLYFSDELRRAINPVESSEIRRINRFASGVLALGYGIFDIREAELYFPTVINGIKYPKTVEQIRSSISIWEDFMQVRNWRRISPHFPLIAELAGDAHFLPHEIKLGDYTTITRAFDHFYLPDVRGAAWSRALYGHLADRYERISDLVLKKGVIDSLFSKVGPGRILDVGCGTGLAYEWKPENVELYGVDVCREMVTYAQSRGEEGRVLDIGYAFPIDFPYTSLDGVIMSYVDNWLTLRERWNAFSLINKLLISGGRLAFNVHNPREEGWETSYEILLSSNGFSKVSFLQESVNSKDGQKLIYFVVAEK